MKNREKTMSDKEWKPEVGKTAWIVRYGTCREGFVDYLDDDVAQISMIGFTRLELKPSCLFPTAEAALASIKVYDLEGNEVVVSRALEVFKEKGAAVILDIFLNEFDVIVQTFRDYRSGEYPLDKFNAYIDRCIKTSDAMKVKAPIYEQELDRIAKLGERPTDERVESDR